MPIPPAPASACRLLAFDTSTERLAVALQAPGGPWTLLAEGGAAASANLLPQAARLLAGAGIAWADLDHIACGHGPGAFTGLRTACAAAQGLAFGLGRPVLLIDSLLIVAADAWAQAGRPAGPLDIGVAMDARMNEVYAAVYRRHDGGWQTLRRPALLGPEAVAADWAGTTPQAVAGSAWTACAGRLAPPAGARVHAEEADRAGALLGLALDAAAAGQGVDAAQALPLYLRDKVALTTRERLGPAPVSP